ncbi:RNA polymerase I associated factor, A49-like protein [Xylona heveae TC161]|uniref:RNA polymerase I associated factor, A49-like protein n=1 Tax=Xylona heveae (strain CBS 132557 / TC161) TaxID=1328760 RepID=A0A164ZHR2_XYLHT|nr:RNA polymerase I associated factor, A49-like protein [Xylona heveae TC161]KZF19117.1 RNA polymerase I associated factor, A49-like protein [Xylona heveae TC161]
MSDPKADKKRKRASQDGSRPGKKVAIDLPAPTVKVSVVPETDEWSPVTAPTPGLSLPSNISFKPYRKARPAARGGHIQSSELLLHSSEHPKIDYTGREEGLGALDGLMKHYVGVYDPKTGELQVMETRNLVLRGTLRAEAQEVQRDNQKTKQALRNTLGMEFGTKKAKKAIASLTENAITASEDAKSTNSVADAVLDSMTESTQNMATREELQAAIDDAKPRPKANLDATTPAEVYPIDYLVGHDEMRTIAVKEWQDAVSANRNIETKSRFVSKRLNKVVASGDIPKIKALRYLLLLLDFHLSLKSGPKGVKKLPQKEEMRKFMGVQDSWIDGVRRRFAEGSQLNKWHMDNLYTHIAALSLIVDNFEVDTYDLKQDLKLEPKAISQYYHEIGCRIKNPTLTDRNKLKITKEEAQAHRIAVLRLPLDFPKTRIVPRRR